MIFISYSHEDHAWKERIEKHLAAISNHSPHKNFYWSDAEISIGDKWQQKINEFREKATVAVFLVSVNFMASSFIKENEYTYFVNKKNVRVVWFYIGVCAWQSMTGLREIEAVKFKNKKLQPLTEMRKPQADKLIAETCKQLYNYVVAADEPRIHYSTEAVYCCNRSKEIQLFRDTSAKFIDINKGQNLLLYSIEGLPVDDLDSLAQSIQYKVLKGRYEETALKWSIRRTVLNLGPLINDVKFNPDILLIRFKDRLQAELKLPVNSIDHFTINDIFSAPLPDEIQRMIYFITINIPSTTFNNIIYKPYFDWIKNEFSIKRVINPNVIVIFIFAFEKEGDVKDLRLESFVKKLTHGSNLPKIFGRQNIIWPNPEKEILHLGEHSEVLKEQIEEWNREYGNGASIDPYVSELKDKMRMSAVIKLLQKIILNK